MKIEDFEFDMATEPVSGVEMVCPDANCPQPFINGGTDMGAAMDAARRHIDDHHHQED